jgi:hypothetical protein
LEKVNIKVLTYNSGDEHRPDNLMHRLDNPILGKGHIKGIIEDR